MNSESREKLLSKIIAYEGDIKRHIQEISKFEWDCESDLVILNRAAIKNMLRKFGNGEITAEQLEEWANFIECREDIGFEEIESQSLSEIVYWLANPDLGYEPNPDLILKIQKVLETNAL